MEATEKRETRPLTPFGRDVKIRLLQIGMSHRELCENVGCGKSYLSDLMTGRMTTSKYTDLIREKLNLPVGKESVNKGA